MHRVSCHACLETFELPAAANHCPGCGADLRAPAGWVIGRRDLRRVAQMQRMLLWSILAQIGCYFLGSAAPPIPAVQLLFIAVYIAVQIVTVVNTVRLSSALGDHIVLRCLGAILMFVPCVNLLLLLGVNGRATRALRKAGLRVGFMGVRDEVVVRFLGVNRCHGCGYNLTGNVSGRCPECGTPAPPQAAF